MSPDSPEEAARKAAERAARMAKFSAKAIDEEDEPVAVRSFNQARSGEDAGKTYSHKTGRVEDSAVSGSSLPRKTNAGPSKIDDDDLLAEIDAAVDAAESAAPAKLPNMNSRTDDDLLAEIDAAVADAKQSGVPTPAPPGMNARRLAAMAQAAGDKPDLPPAPGTGAAGAPRLPKGLAGLAGTAGEVDIKPPAGSFAGMSGAGLGTRKKGPTDLSEDDLAGLRPKDGVKPSSASVRAASNPPADEDPDAPAVVSGRGRGTPVRHSAQDDDDLLAEIDAAVEAAEAGGLQEGAPGALKSADDSQEDVADEGRKKGQPAYSGGSIKSPGDEGGFEAKVGGKSGKAATPVVGNATDGEFAVKSDKPKAASAPALGEDMKFAVKSDKGHATGGDDFLSAGKFEAKLDKESRPAPKIMSPADAMKFEAKMDREEREAIKIHNPTDTDAFDVSKDQSSDELAKNADAAVETPAAGVQFTRAQTHKGKDLPKLRSPGDQPVAARRDAEPKPLPKMHSAGDQAVSARQDRGQNEGPAFKGFKDAPVEAKMDRENRGGHGKIHSPGESRPDVKMDRESRGNAPKILSPADAERYAVNLDRAARDTPMPKMANPAEGGFETKQDAQSKAPPKLRNAAEGGFETKQDAQRKELPHLRNPTESDIHARQDAQSKAPPKLRNAAEGGFETKQDAQRKALPNLRNATDESSIQARQDAQRKELPQLRNATDAAPIQAKRDAEPKPLPRMQNSADADSYEAKFAWRQKQVTGIRNAADEKTESKMDREQREKAHLFNPGQGEFDVKYEHESIWTTKPKRDRDDDSPSTSDKKKSK